MRSRNNTSTSQQTTFWTRIAVQWWRWSFVIASAVGVLLTGITEVAEAQAPQQDAPSVQKVSREQADKIMNMNYKEFAELRKSAKRPKGYRWDTDGCTPAGLRRTSPRPATCTTSATATTAALGRTPRT
ncbi:MAG: hypothetical protein ACREXW_15185 [Gammaproteobacteria bacterium]